MAREIFGRELIPWRPVRELDRVFDEMERTFEEIFGRPFYPVTWRRSPTVRPWSPPLEIYEKGDEYVVKAELPGMKKDEIDISILENTLSIKGELKAEEEVTNEDYHLCERCYGSFERAVTLPTEVDAARVEANYTDGILEIKLPKVPQAKPKKLDIKTK
jgi:HSP20 family protein